MVQQNIAKYTAASNPLWGIFTILLALCFPSLIEPDFHLRRRHRSIVLSSVKLAKHAVASSTTSLMQTSSSTR